MNTFALFLFLGVISRLIDHPANFTPIGALIIFYGAKKGSFNAALLAISIMVISDVLLGFSFASIFVYTGFVIYALTAKLYKTKFGIITAPVISSIIFFVVTNFGVWLGPWYEHNIEGLMKCFTLAIPFYRNTVLGDIVFIFLIYLAYQTIGESKYKKHINKLEGAWQQLLIRVNLKKG